MYYNCDLETGDILCFKRQGVIGHLISWRTGGDRSHAEIVVVDGRRNWSVGAHSSGVQITPASNLLIAGEELRVMRMPAGQTLPDCWQDLLAQHAIDAVGLWAYRYGHLFQNLFPKALFGEKGDPAKIPSSVMCSEFCSLELRLNAGFDPCPEWADSWTTPDDLAYRSRLVCVCEQLRFAAGYERL